MGKVKVICNTSPIIGLMAINRLSLLWQLFDEIFIPEAVKKELCATSPEHSKEIEEIKRNIEDGKFTVYQVHNAEIVKSCVGNQGAINLMCPFLHVRFNWNLMELRVCSW